MLIDKDLNHGSGQFVHSSRELRKEYANTINTECPEICTMCGGRCCKKFPCHMSPDDFEDLSLNSLIRELNKGYISIAKARKDVFSKYRLFLRMRVEGHPIVDLDVDEKKLGPCVLLTPTGCILPYEKRTMGAKFLVPFEEKNGMIHCLQYYGQEELLEDWKPYQNILRVLCVLYTFQRNPKILKKGKVRK